MKSEDSKRRVTPGVIAVFMLLLLTTAVVLVRDEGDRIRTTSDAPGRNDRRDQRVSVREGKGNVNTFSDGSSEKDVYFYSPGNNDTVSIELPTGVNITHASLNIEGIPFSGNIRKEFSFNDTATHSAYWGGVVSGPSLAPSNYKINTYAKAQLVKLQNRDGVLLGTGNIIDQYAYQMFEFSLGSPENVSEMEVHWEGGGLGRPEMGFETSGVKWYIYDAKATIWRMVDDFHVGEIWDEKALKKTYSNSPADHIDNNGDVYFFVITRVGGSGFTTYVKTDFTNLFLTYDLYDYPEDPSLNLNAEGENEWEYDGVFREKVTVGDKQDLKGTLQNIVDATAGEKVTVDLALSSAAPGILRLNGLDIGYEVIPENVPPHMTGALSEEDLSFPEDSDQGMGLVDLYDLFDDDGGAANLSFTVLKNHTSVAAYVNTSAHSLDLIAEKDFFGVRDFRIRATDKEGLYVESDLFDVVVTPTNDPPYISNFNGIESPSPDEILPIRAPEGGMTELNFSVWDIDGDLPRARFGSELPEDLFDLRSSSKNASKATLLISPEDRDVGSVNISLLLDDLNHTERPLSTRYDLSVEIVNTNDPPVMNDPGDHVVREDEQLEITLLADDIDLNNDPDEELTFFSNLSDQGVPLSYWELEPDTGAFSFHPDNVLVGKYRVNFSVEDHYGKGDWVHVVLEVKNVNDPPIAKPISYDIRDADETTPEKENLTVLFTTEEADDPDILHGDHLEYIWDFDASDGVGADATGRRSRWTYGRSGNYTVTLTVRDSGEPRMLDTTTEQLHVIEPPSRAETKPSEDDGKPTEEQGKDHGTDKRSGGTTAWWIALLITTVLIVIGILIFLTLGKKGKKGEKASKGRGEPERTLWGGSIRRP